MAFIWTMKSDILVIKTDIGYLQRAQQNTAESLKQFGAVLTSGAVRDARIAMIEKRIDELAHGKGFIEN